MLYKMAELSVLKKDKTELPYIFGISFLKKAVRICYNYLYFINYTKDVCFS